MQEFTPAKLAARTILPSYEVQETDQVSHFRRMFWPAPIPDFRSLRLRFGTVLQDVNLGMD
jgi:hypothetical protein